MPNIRPEDDPMAFMKALGEWPRVTVLWPSPDIHEAFGDLEDQVDKLIDGRYHISWDEDRGTETHASFVIRTESAADAATLLQAFLS